MSATSRAAASAPDPSDVAATLRAASLVRLLVRADGDAIAAAGVLARTCSVVGTPFQASPTATRIERVERTDQGDPDATTVAIGPAEGADVTLPAVETPAAPVAADVARECGVDPAVELALAGAVAAGTVPGDGTGDLLEMARERGLERGPGVGVPVGDLATGLAHSTLVHAPFSGDRAAVADLLATLGIDPDATVDELDADQRRTVASHVAIEATAGDSPERAAVTVERAVHPHAIDGPFATLEGYADVLDVAAATAPGTAIAHAVGGTAVDALTTAWTDGARAVHDAIVSADHERYGGVVFARVGEAPAAPAARVLRDSRSPEPIALALGDGRAAVAARDGHDARPATAALADATGGTADGTARRGHVTFEGDVHETALIETVREAL